MRRIQRDLDRDLAIKKRLRAPPAPQARRHRPARTRSRPAIPPETPDTPEPEPEAPISILEPRAPEGAQRRELDLSR